MMRRGWGARESQRYWGSVTRLQRRGGKTANRTKKGETSAPSKHWIYGCCCSSHGQKKTNELLLNISHAPLPRHHSQAPLHFSRCDNIPQLHWLELSYLTRPSPSLHFAGYKETDDRSNYPPMMGWLCSYCHHGFVTIVIHLDINSRHHYRPVAFDVTASLPQSPCGACHKLIGLFEMSHNCVGFEFPQQQTRTFRRTEQNKG